MRGKGTRHLRRDTAADRGSPQNHLRNRRSGRRQHLRPRPAVRVSDRNTLGWVLIVLGVIQLGGGVSLFAGNTFGRIVAIVGAGLGAIVALLSVGGDNPGRSLGVFLLCVYVIHGIHLYGEVQRAAGA
jgi:hypothetical protein